MEKENIGITGHTSGIGFAINERLQKMGFKTIQFSRSNGFDIKKEEDRKKIITKVENCFVFINCAAAGWGQTDLLYELFEKWQHHSKHIINISSNTADIVKTKSYKYSVEKNSLDQACLQLSYAENTKCKVTNIRPKWVDTPRISSFNVQEIKLLPSDVADVIEYILKLPPNIHLSQLCIQAWSVS